MSFVETTDPRDKENEMIDPASMLDWIQASLMVGLAGAVGALTVSALRERRDEPGDAGRGTAAQASA